MNTFSCLLPLDCPTDEVALKDFDDLTSYSPRVRRAAWQSRSNNLPSVYDYTLPVDRVGMASSNRFHYSSRMACDSINSPSVIRSWYIQKFRKGLEASVFYEKSPKTALALRKYIPSQFRPAAAKTIYTAFCAKRVYDPCMGWGDRLSGALASNVELYYGRDVNPFLFGGYSEQVKRLPSNTNVHFEMIGAETGAPREQYFDLTFTSPPYYKVEKYAGEMQSHALFKTFDEWLRGFLFPLGKNCLDAIHDYGHVALNMSDVYCNHRVNVMCEPFIAHMTSLGATYKGAVGYEMGKRLNKNNSQSQTAGFSEPVLVFGKRSELSLDDLFSPLCAQ
jgi:hypothetical protein